jgi:hypothetical protein
VFKEGDKVLLFNSKVKLFGEGPYTIIHTSSHGAITIQEDEGNIFKVNSQRLKVFLDPSYNPKEKIDVIKLISFNKFPNSK